MTVFKCLHGEGPSYITLLLEPHNPTFPPLLKQRHVERAKNMEEMGGQSLLCGRTKIVACWRAAQAEFTSEGRETSRTVSSISVWSKSTLASPDLRRHPRGVEDVQKALTPCCSRPSGQQTACMSKHTVSCVQWGRAEESEGSIGTSQQPRATGMRWCAESGSPPRPGHRSVRPHLPRR